MGKSRGKNDVYIDLPAKGPQTLWPAQGLQDLGVPHAWCGGWSGHSERLLRGSVAKEIV